MTLSTDIYLATTRTPDEVYLAVNGLLNIPASRISGEKTYPWNGGITRRSNAPGQGFPAWVSMEYKPDGSLIVSNENDCTEMCDEEDEGDYHFHRPVHNVKVNLDTAYGYNVDGMGCADLHATVIVGLLEIFGEDLQWRNEFTGDIFKNLDGIEEFISSTDKMRDWFDHVIMTLKKSLL